MSIQTPLPLGMDVTESGIRRYRTFQNFDADGDGADCIIGRMVLLSEARTYGVWLTNAPIGLIPFRWQSERIFVLYSW